MKKPPAGSARALIPVPLYGQVLSVLRQRIVDGIFAPDDQLPPEDQLATEFAVSRATIRQAVGELVREGLVSRRQGRGTFVLANEHRHSQKFHGSLSDVLAETEGSKTVETDIERETAIPRRIADSLRLEKPIGTILRRTRAIDGQVYAFGMTYLPTHFGSLIADDDLQKTGLIRLLTSKGVRVGSAQQLIRAEQADIEICRRLDLELGSPVLYAERLVLSVDGEPIQFVKNCYRADLFEYRVNLAMDDSDGKLRLHPV